MLISDEPFVAFLLCNPSRIWPGTVQELPKVAQHTDKANIAKIAPTLEGQKGPSWLRLIFLPHHSGDLFDARNWSGKGLGSIWGADLEKFWDGWEMLPKLTNNGAGKHGVGWFLGRRGSV